jgi:hypothetical protein
MPSNARTAIGFYNFHVMDMASANALFKCSRACNDLMGEVMRACASRTEDGVVLVMHLDEDGEEITLWAVSMEAPKLQMQKAFSCANKLRKVVHT